MGPDHRNEFETGKFLYKQSDIGQSKQAKLCIDAEKFFENCDFYHPLNTVYVSNRNVIISRKSEYLRFQEQIALNGFPNPISWYKQLNKVANLSGRWLKYYHEFGRNSQDNEGRESVSSPLLKYIDARKYILDALPSGLRNRFLESVRGCPDHFLTTVHSDFAPPNIFSDGEKISVIDFGVAEWTAMSPYWDIATFVIYLTRENQFRMKSPLKWLPFLRARVLSNFFEAYGDVYGADPKVWRICCASRHFALLSALVESNTADRRFSWHIDQMQKMLEPEPL
ncbi:MAG: phosphotransferase [Alphaproteobacteria bacterium]|nr:phosphotransferase [Alphaproteobacteria bacterium]